MPSKRQLVQVGGHELTVSNVEKVYFPESGFTKGEVIAFYSEIADYILPHLRDRPLTLKRYPDGVKGEPFYEKNAPVHTPGWVARFGVPRSEGGGEIRYVLCNDLATLVWVTNLGDIEKHVLLGQAPDLDCPTAVVFDLDPGEPASILECGEVALELKKVFDALKLEVFVKVSGSKGLHLTVPLNGGLTYDTVQPFAKTMAELMAKQMPDRVVSDMAKTLRKGKVLIDWSQNSDFKTTVCVYAMRAKRGEPFISMPITWAELAKAVKKRDAESLFFTPAAAVKRLKKLGDLYAPVLTLKQDLPAQFTQALAAGPARKLSRWPRNDGGAEKVRDKSLREYAAKRDHTQTAEPEAKVVRGKRGGQGATRDDGKGPQRFVIQKHEASHLHYDFRLAMQGVLRSWAVPKGPPRKPKEARLAMHVEDHPMEYADFEGTIPAGNYGAGTVMVWDQGEYEDITGNAVAAYYGGKMHIKMRGKKLNGEWILLKDKREGEDSNKWLLIKAGTELKLSDKADDTSFLSGRSMKQITKANDKQWQSNRAADGSYWKADEGKNGDDEADARPNLKKRIARRLASEKKGEVASKGAAVKVNAKAATRGKPKTKTTTKAKAATGAAPVFVEPMQCKPVTALPDTGDWWFEIKYDGYRCIALKKGDEVELLSRNGNKLNGRFPEVVAAMADLDGDFAMDGEIVAIDEAGRHSFQLLQNQGSKNPAVLFYAFDLINRDGEDLVLTPIEQRKQELQEVLAQAADPLRLSPSLEAAPEDILAAVEQLGLEGVVGKRKGSVYEAGERSGAWIKHRSHQAQEFVIGGYVPGNRGFDSLVVGVYEKKQLRYVGKVKNGFVPRVRDEVFELLKPLKLKQTECPFVNLPEKKGSRWGESMTEAKMAECRWVKPVLVCQVAFLEWTDAAHLRHCTFRGMRDDKPATKVVRET